MTHHYILSETQTVEGVFIVQLDSEIPATAIMSNAWIIIQSDGEIPPKASYCCINATRRKQGRSRTNKGKETSIARLSTWWTPDMRRTAFIRGGWCRLERSVSRWKCKSVWHDCYMHLTAEIQHDLYNIKTMLRLQEIQLLNNGHPRMWQKETWLHMHENLMKRVNIHQVKFTQLMECNEWLWMNQRTNRRMVWANETDKWIYKWMKEERMIVQYTYL